MNSKVFELLLSQLHFIGFPIMLINDGSKGSIVVDVTVVIAGITVGTIRTPVHFFY